MDASKKTLPDAIYKVVMIIAPFLVSSHVIN